MKKAAADYKFAHSPAGRAREAAERGDTIFEYQAMVTRRGNGRDLSAIEAEGWTLDDTKFHTESRTEKEPDGSETTDTMTYALYVFRRTE